MNRRARAALFLAVALTACPAPTQTPPSSPSASASSPLAGGSITVAYPMEPPTLDPFARAGRAAATRDLVRLVMPSLVRDDGSRWLLAGEPVVRDGPPFTVELTLRADAVWSDGRPITVADLRRTWRIARALPVYRWITAIRDLGNGRAAMELDRPTDRWRELFSSGLGVVPAHVPRARLDRRWPVSGGPYVLERWRRGLDMRFVRNPLACCDAVPAIDEIRVVFVPDSTGALLLFEGGEVDVLGPYHTPDWQRRLSDAGATVVSATGTTRARLVWDTSRLPFSSRAVRSAVRSSFDHERIVRGLVGSEGSLPDRVLTEDLAAARRRLRAAGWRGEPVRARGGRELSATVVVMAGDDLGSVVAHAIKFHVERAGIRLELIPLEPDRFWDEWIDSSDMRAAFIVDLTVPTAFDGIELYEVTVSLGSGPEVQIAANAGPDGAFARAHTWRAA